MRSKGKRRIAFDTTVQKVIFNCRNAPHPLTYPVLCLPHLWNAKVLFIQSHHKSPSTSLNSFLNSLQHKKKRALPKIYNVILPQFSPCQHPISSASHLPEYITKIFHCKRSCHSEMNTNGAVFDLIRVEWSFDLSPRFNNGLPIMCQFRFLPCFPASMPHLPHISQASALLFLLCLFSWVISVVESLPGE